MSSIETARRNRILAMLPADDLGALLPALEPHALTMREVLEPRGKAATHVYFPTDGVVSMTTLNDAGDEIEVATIGYEGMVGISVFLGGEDTALESYIQIPGASLRLPRAIFAEFAERRSIDRILKTYTQALFNQVAQSSACNRIHPVEQRCSRWLLQTHDRMRLRSFELTHEFLAMMLAVRRATVSEVAARLQTMGLIHYRRGVIDVLDRPGLERASCPCYGLVAREYERLLGVRPRPA